MGVGYLLWRPTTFNPDAPVFSMILYAAELFGFVVSALHLFICWRLSRRAAPTPVPGLSVDVFVTTLDEPLSMLRRTLLAARDMDYPHRTWLLDEGHRSQMQALAEELGVRYLARDLSTDGSSTTLNCAVRQSEGDFLAIFDADHVPARHFLTRTLGFFREDRVAFVQTPQGICNAGSLQHRTDRGKRLVWNEQSIFSRVIQPGRDYWNAALFCGSCAVLRRAALDAVGGFATSTPCEDLHTSLRLHKRGYKSVYLSEPLVFAMSPRNLGPFLREQVRGSRGALQVWAREGIVFCRGLSLPQRASYVGTVLAYFNGWQKGVFYLSPAVVLVSGTMPIAALDTQFLLHFLPYFLLSLWSLEEVGRGYGRTSLIEQFNMVRFGALVAAAVGIAEDPGRSSTARKSGSGEAKAKHLAWPQQAVLAVSLAAIPFGLAHHAWHQILPLSALAASVLWALLNAGLAAAAVSVTLKSVPLRRADYRFAIPLPARLKFPVDEPVYGIVDNISSSGFRFHGRFPEYAQFGAKVSGELYLPGGALPLQATIRSFYLGHEKKGEHHGKSVGLSFDVVAPGDERLLERFLYGSDLQWRINELIDRSETPVGFLARLLRCGGARHYGRAEHWAPAILQSVDGSMSRPEVGMISLPVHRDAPRRVLALAPAPVGKRLRVSVAASTARHPVEGTLATPHILDTPLAPIYDYAFAVEARSKD
jgi:cellulose synthase (UDP-forming)